MINFVLILYSNTMKRFIKGVEIYGVPKKRNNSKIVLRYKL